MSKCDNCRLRKETDQAFDIHWLGEEDCPYDVCPEIKTNADKIRAMSDEELAVWMCDRSCSLCPLKDCKGRMEVGRTVCYNRWLDWLRQEVEQ